MRVVQRYMTAITLVALIALSGGCLNPFGTDRDNSERTDDTAQERSTGILRVFTGTNSVSASTITPDNDLVGQVYRYRLVLTGVDENEGETITIDPYDNGTDIELSFGPWIVHLEGYDGSNNLIAEGLVRDGDGGYAPDQRIIIGTGDNIATVELRPLITEGETGTLVLEVSWPPGLNVTVAPPFLLRFIADAESWTYGGLEEVLGPEDYTITGTGLEMTRELASGYWELELSLLTDGSPYTALIEIVHIHDNLKSHGSFDLTGFFPATYTVTFDANAAEAEDPTPPNKLVAQGSPYGALAATNRTGYSLSGWFTASVGGALIEPETLVSIEGDHTLYAQWTANTYTITLDKQGGDGGTNIVIASYDAPMPEATAPSHEEYAFRGYWSEPGGVGTQYYTGTMTSANDWDIADDTTLYAHWGPWEIGNIGPAGGFVFYDKGEYTDDWRYLEAAAAYTEWIGQWGGSGSNVGGTLRGVGTGRSNTLAIVNFFYALEHVDTGESYFEFDWDSVTEGTVPFTDGVSVYDLSFQNDGTVAAVICESLEVEFNGVISNDWFLPSPDELNLVYENLRLEGIGGFATIGIYWTSSDEWSNVNALGRNFNTGGEPSDPKRRENRVRAIRSF